MDISFLGSLYSWGVQGITKDALDNPALCRCLNQFLRSRIGDANATWASLSVNRAGDVPLRSDSWNQQGSTNYAISLGGRQFLWHTQGEIPGSKPAGNLTPPGAAAEGFISEFLQRGKAVRFNPRLPHAVVSMPDIVISAYTPNSWSPPPEEHVGALKNLGFPVSQAVGSIQGCPGIGVGVPQAS